MLNEVGVKLENIDRVFLAGAFGNYLNIENAMNIGMLPQVPIEKIESVGNSSGLGAIECITHPTCWDIAHKVASSAIHIELATLKIFIEIC